MATDYATEPVAAQILRLGDPGLRQRSAPILDFVDPAFVSNQRRLHATLAAFRRANGFGRAISAPQIGVSQRFVALNLGDGPRLLVNPEIVLGQPIDHLDGILAVDRVLDDESLVMREVFEAQ